MERFILALVRFYEHNDPLVFLAPVILASLVFLLVKPRRSVAFLLFGALLLLLEFEYSKVIFRQIKEDWLGQLFTADFHFRRYQISVFFFQTVVPFLMSFMGWFLITLAAILR